MRPSTKGWIFAGKHDHQWTQKVHRNHSQRFQNPLLQNYKHTECLRGLLGLTKNKVPSVAVFTGECTLKTRDKLPEHGKKPRPKGGAFVPLEIPGGTPTARVPEDLHEPLHGWFWRHAERREARVPVAMNGP
ncbi:MAG: NERD domain-containing protein [Lentisphaeria bacterium]|nr:NERD domain-containing protein [Lentisphaeria bacterium]